jgi:uncharacterized membrane protein
VTVRLRHAWETLRSTYWFVPSLMTAAAAALAVASVMLDRRVGGDVVDELGWVFSGGSEGARAVLQVIAGSVMSTAGIVFSVTIAALSLASSQLGPRLLQNFMRDLGNQVVLGTFIATYIFCLLVLRTIRGEDTGDFIPAISVTVAVLLALASVGVLIYFIHHVSVSIQAPNVVAEVGAELARHAEAAFRAGERMDEHPEPPPLPDDYLLSAVPVAAARDGYVQALDEEALVELAREHDLVVAVEHRPGRFVVEGGALAYLWPPERCVDGLPKKARSLFVLGEKRTPEQDVEFAAGQLVEVAVRALSPSVNDPFTAVACLDWLGAGLCRAARGRAPGPVRADREGRPRLLFRAPITFGGLADRAFDQIRQYGAATPAVAIRMLETIETVARCTGGRRDELRVLLEHGEQVHRAAAAAIDDPRDLRDLEERWARLRALDGGDGSRP